MQTTPKVWEPTVSKAGVMYLSQHRLLHIHGRQGMGVVCIQEGREFPGMFLLYLQNPGLLFLVLKPFLTILPTNVFG